MIVNYIGEATFVALTRDPGKCAHLLQGIYSEAKSGKNQPNKYDVPLKFVKNFISRAIGLSGSPQYQA
jgi:hypothetical protein